MIAATEPSGRGAEKQARKQPNDCSGGGGGERDARQGQAVSVEARTHLRRVGEKL